MLEEVKEALSTILKVELTLFLKLKVLNPQILKVVLLFVEGLDLGFLVLLNKSLCSFAQKSVLTNNYFLCILSLLKVFLHVVKIRGDIKHLFCNDAFFLKESKEVSEHFFLWRPFIAWIATGALTLELLKVRIVKLNIPSGIYDFNHGDFNLLFT